MRVYRKIYSITQQKFEHNFIEKVLPPNHYRGISSAFKPAPRSRVFWGQLKNNRFKVFTYPNPAMVIFPKNYFRYAFIFSVPTHIYGSIHEAEGKAIVQYSFQKADFVYVILAFGVIMCSFTCVAGVIDVMTNGISHKTLLSGCVIAFFTIMGILIFKSPQSEKEALHKFMDNLDA